MCHGVAGPFVVRAGVGQDKASLLGYDPARTVLVLMGPECQPTLFSRIEPRSMIAIGIYAG